MFEPGLDVDALLALASGLSRLDRSVGDDTRVDRLRALELLKAAASAAQARDAADLDASQRQVQAAAGVPAAERGRGVAEQVALARRDSPHRGGRHLGLAKALVHEMPGTMAALFTGRISEWRTTILVRETAVLTRQDREAVDHELAGDAAALDRLEQLGDRALAALTKQVAYRLDPRSVVDRASRAESERRVTLRPAPDTMAYLTALLPVRHAVAVHAALARTAEAARCAGDRRSRGQLMADTLVVSIAGGAKAGSGVGVTDDAEPASTSELAGGAVGARGAAQPAAPEVAVRFVMTDRSLLDGDHEPALLDDYGPVPAAWARDMVATTLDDGARVFLTRLLTDEAGALVGMESRARLAPTGLAEVIRTRDACTCRSAWCDAPALHVDHVVPHAAGRADELGQPAGALREVQPGQGISRLACASAARRPSRGRRRNAGRTEPAAHGGDHDADRSRVRLRGAGTTLWRQPVGGAGGQPGGAGSARAAGAGRLRSATEASSRCRVSTSSR